MPTPRGLGCAWAWGSGDRDGPGPGLGPIGGGRTPAVRRGGLLGGALVDEEGETLRFVASDGAGAEAIVGVSIPVRVASPAGRRCRASRSRCATCTPTPGSPATSPSRPIRPVLDPRGADDDQPRARSMGVTSVLDPSVDEASDWTLQVLGTLASQWRCCRRERPTARHAVDPRRSGPRRSAPSRWQPPGSRPRDRGLPEPGEHRTGLVRRVRPGATREVAAPCRCREVREWAFGGEHRRRGQGRGRSTAGSTPTTRGSGRGGRRGVRARRRGGHGYRIEDEVRTATWSATAPRAPGSSGRWRRTPRSTASGSSART